MLPEERERENATARGSMLPKMSHSQREEISNGYVRITRVRNGERHA